MQFVVISGMSGAGKSCALNTFEDLGFYCVDNMPITLIPKFAELALASGERYENVALVTDVRAGEGTEEMFEALREILPETLHYHIIFLDASTQTLINRYKETRRRHPLAETAADISSAITREREWLDGVRRQADYVIDTTALSASKLREYLIALFLDKDHTSPILISVLSFGFKYGIPTESDLVFDVRFLPNPYYDAELRRRTGMDDEVRAYVFRSGEADQLMEKLRDLLRFLIPAYIKEGKNSLVISIGCTGGRHRSVAISEALAAFLREEHYLASVSHRDVGRRSAPSRPTPAD